MIAAASAGSVVVRDSASLSETESATSRCWAPSWRLRSSTRRASSAASMMRVRDARISSSCRLRSVTSMPESSTSDASRPVTSSIGVAVHAITMWSPLALRQRVSRSTLGTPFAAEAIAIRAK